jgi:hypothetical protein
MKIAKVYEGWKKKTPGSKEYCTENRMYIAGLKKAFLKHLAYR